jgi:hypothetical protein
VVNRWPTFWRGFRPPRPGAAVAGVAKIELGFIDRPVPASQDWNVETFDIQ